MAINSKLEMLDRHFYCRIETVNMLQAPCALYHLTYRVSIITHIYLLFTQLRAEKEQFFRIIFQYYTTRAGSWATHFHCQRHMRIFLCSCESVTFSSCISHFDFAIVWHLEVRARVRKAKIGSLGENKLVLEAVRRRRIPVDLITSLKMCLCVCVRMRDYATSMEILEKATLLGKSYIMPRRLATSDLLHPTHYMLRQYNICDDARLEHFMYTCVYTM